MGELAPVNIHSIINARAAFADDLKGNERRGSNQGFWSPDQTRARLDKHVFNWSKKVVAAFGNGNDNTFPYNPSKLHQRREVDKVPTIQQATDNSITVFSAPVI